MFGKDLELFKSLVDDIKMFIRPRIVFLEQTDKDFVDLLKSKKIYYGIYDGRMIDLYIHLDKEKNIREYLDKYQIRYILCDHLDVIDGYEFVPGVFNRYRLNLFRRKNMIKVCCFPINANSNNAVVWYRLQLPAIKIWEQYPDIDIRIVFPPNYNDIYWSDILIFQRWFSGGYDLMKFVRQFGKKIIFETDDLDIYISQDNPLFHAYQIGNVKQEIIGMVNFADYVVVSTEQLKNELLNFNTNIKVLKNKIDLDRPMWRGEKEKSDLIKIYWVGAATHYADLQILKDVLRQVCDRFENVRFVLCGYNKGGVRYTCHEDKKTGFVSIREEKLDRGIWDVIVDEFKNVLGDKFLYKEALPIDQYGFLYKDADIVVVPLIDNRFNRCKSELKVIEAGAYGIPVVASDVVSYSSVIKNGVNGFLVNKYRDWIKCLSRLIVDENLRRQMGNSLKEIVYSEYNAKEQEDRVSLFRELVNCG